MTTISDFVRHHYRHFNAGTLVDAADAYLEHLDSGGKMLVAMAGAMSTSELGTPMFVIESDATIVAPLIFASVLGW